MKLTKDNYITMLQEKHGDNFTFLEEFINSKTPIKCKCNKCNYIWKKAPYELIIRGTGCPNCSSLSGKGRKISFTEKDFENKLIDLFGENPYEFITPFKGYKERITVKCKECGYIFDAKPSNLTLKTLKHPTCSNCLKNNHKMTTEKYQNKLDKHFGKEKSYTILEEYIDENTAIKHRCNICNYEWKTSPANIYRGMYGKTRVCPSCNNMKRDDFNNLTYKERLEKINSKIIPLEEYKGRRVKIKHKCTECGFEWLTAPNNPLSGEGCPKCSNKITQSKFELDLINMIKKESNLKVIEKDRTVLKGQELDIYIPEKNIAFEIDGLYWHCDDYKNKDYHINKTKACKEKGIRLIHIFDDENYKIVESKVKHLLGLNNNLPKVYARKCYIEEINNSYKNEFLNENHIQGTDKSSIKLGLWYPNEEGDILVAVMTFCMLRSHLNNKNRNKKDYELSRFATENNFLVIGAFGKLFKYFKENYNFNTITTYADLRWSQGNIYYKYNFKMDHITKPNYFYFNRNTGIRYHRFNFRKSELKKKFPKLYSDDKTEFQIMNETKIYKRIYDCGNMVFIYN